MGFTTGFTGGVTLTVGLAYLTVLAHERNRQAQAHNLRSQSRILTSLVEPQSLQPPQNRAELAREGRGTLVETAKDRWNEEVENAVRWVQRTDWGEVREGMEGAISRLLGSGLHKSREVVEEVEKQAGPKVQDSVDKIKSATRKGADQAATGIDKAAVSTIATAEKEGDAAGKGVSKAMDTATSKADSAVTLTKSKFSQAGEKTAEYEASAKSSAHNVADSIKNGGGTVDAARGAVRNVISKGIEKGKEAIGKAQAVVGLAADTIESEGQASTLSHSSAVEKALKERYEKPNGLNKSVEDALAERYEPIDSRDNTVLRGV